MTCKGFGSDKRDKLNPKTNSDYCTIPCTMIINSHSLLVDLIKYKIINNSQGSQAYTIVRNQQIAYSIQLHSRLCFVEVVVLMRSRLRCSI